MDHSFGLQANYYQKKMKRIIVSYILWFSGLRRYRKRQIVGQGIIKSTEVWLGSIWQAEGAFKDNI